jgi:hypothetical protein
MLRLKREDETERAATEASRTSWYVVVKIKIKVKVKVKVELARSPTPTR